MLSFETPPAAQDTDSTTKRPLRLPWSRHIGLIVISVIALRTQGQTQRVAGTPRRPSSPRRTPAATAAVPGGWIALTREGLCDANIGGIRSSSGVPQSLVQCPHGDANMDHVYPWNPP